MLKVTNDEVDHSAHDHNENPLVWKTSNKTQNIASCQKLGDEKVKANLFRLGVAKDVSSEMFKQDSNAGQQTNRQSKNSNTGGAFFGNRDFQGKIEVEDSQSLEAKTIAKQQGQIFVKSITSAKGSVTLFDKQQPPVDTKPTTTRNRKSKNL